MQGISRCDYCQQLNENVLSCTQCGAPLALPNERLGKIKRDLRKGWGDDVDTALRDAVEKLYPYHTWQYSSRDTGPHQMSARWQRDILIDAEKQYKKYQHEFIDAWVESNPYKSKWTTFKDWVETNVIRR